MAKETSQNRLIHEKSPYLLQHAENPVDWHPWGEEAFEKAKSQDKPVFLSIGYSTCHWCHVMAHESFEDENIAAYINAHFIPIKVDREERPDIDNIYMSAVQAMTGSGGWPLSVFLTADKKPFYGGTYFPPYAKWGTPGFMDLLNSLNQTWQTNRTQITESGQKLTQLLQDRAAVPQGAGVLSVQALDRGYDQFESMYDDTFAGFGSQPKFPSSHNLSFLLRYWKRTQKEEALAMVEHTLTEMAKGGMYDQIGGGFHRYSVDRQWQIPHFEKMLYDQAILARTYLEAFQITQKPFYAQMAREIFDYVLRDMTDAEGGFYSAEDADSFDPDEFKNMTPDPHAEKKEGAFYLFRDDELNHLLSEEEASVIRVHYGFQERGNAKSDPHGEFTGKNVLFIDKNLDETAKQLNKKRSEVDGLLSTAEEKLLKERSTRPRPHLDDKILVDWNGLMIGALAYGGRVLKEKKYIEAAAKSADFIIKNLVKEDKLLHRYRDGEAGIDGTIEDYAFFVHGLLDLYQAGFNLEYLTLAEKLTHHMVDYFWDEKEGGFFFVSENSEALLFKQKELYDGAIPSGNSVAALNLIRLYHITFNSKWEEILSQQMTYFAGSVLQRPSAYAEFLMALDFTFGPSQEIVIVEDLNGDASQEYIEMVNEYFLPNSVILLKKGEGLAAIAPFTKEQNAMKNKTTIYVCENRVCKLPVTDLKSLKNILTEK